MNGAAADYYEILLLGKTSVWMNKDGSRLVIHSYEGKKYIYLGDFKFEEIK